MHTEYEKSQALNEAIIGARWSPQDLAGTSEEGLATACFDAGYKLAAPAPLLGVVPAAPASIWVLQDNGDHRVVGVYGTEAAARQAIESDRNSRVYPTHTDYYGVEEMFIEAPAPQLLEGVPAAEQYQWGRPETGLSDFRLLVISTERLAEIKLADAECEAPFDEIKLFSTAECHREELLLELDAQLQALMQERQERKRAENDARLQADKVVELQGQVEYNGKRAETLAHENKRLIQETYNWSDAVKKLEAERPAALPTIGEGGGAVIAGRLPDAFTNAIGLLEHLGREGVAEHLQSVARNWMAELYQYRLASNRSQSPAALQEEEDCCWPSECDCAGPYKCDLGRTKAKQRAEKAAAPTPSEKGSHV
jgi:hypothetical protein